MYALILDGNGRIKKAVAAENAEPGAVYAAKLPEGELSDYIFTTGECLYSPDPDKRIAELEEALALLLSGATE